MPGKRPLKGMEMTTPAGAHPTIQPKSLNTLPNNIELEQNKNDSSMSRDNEFFVATGTNSVVGEMHGSLDCLLSIVKIKNLN